MGECRIIIYLTEYQEALRDYLHKTYPRYSELYVDYCLQQISLKSDEQTAILVVNGNNEIVGCNLFFNTKAMMLGNVIKVRWSYNTYLDAEYRKTIGLEFVFEIRKTNYLGIGLSDVNRKIQKMLKMQFIDGLYNYFFVNSSVLMAVLKHLFFAKCEIVEVGFIKIGSKRFERVYSSAELNIPNEGFWLNGQVDVEFIRDKYFFDYRFFNNKVYNYSVYKLIQEDGVDSCYFVARPILFKGVPTLLLVDFRYDMKHPEYGALIIQAANKLARRSKMGGVLCMTNDPNVSCMIRKKLLSFKSPNDLLVPKSFGLVKNAKIFVTSADSDADFLR